MSPLSASLVYVECKTAKPENLHAFYKNILDFEVSPADPIPFYVQVKIGNNTLMGFRKSDSNIVDQSSIYIHVNDLDITYSTLMDKGLNPSDISSEVWGHPATTIQDPDGRLLVFTKQSH